MKIKLENMNVIVDLVLLYTNVICTVFSSLCGMYALMKQNVFEHDCSDANYVGDT